MISRIESKISIPQIDTLCGLVEVLGYEITYKSKGTASTVKKQESKPVVTEIDLTDIPDDSVITYKELKQYIDSDEGKYHRGHIKDLELYSKWDFDNFICMPDANYQAKVVENALIEIKAMFEKDKISQKRLQRIQEDLHYAMEVFQDIYSNIEAIADFSVETLMEIIDAINEDDDFDDEEE